MARKPTQEPKSFITATAEGLRYQMTVKVGGRPARFFSGTSQAELDRDLAEAAAEIGRSR